MGEKEEKREEKEENSVGPWRAPKFSSGRGKKKTKAVEEEENRKVKEGKMEKGKEICG